MRKGRTGNPRERVGELPELQTSQREETRGGDGRTVTPTQRLTLRHAENAEWKSAGWVISSVERKSGRTFRLLLQLCGRLWDVAANLEARYMRSLEQMHQDKTHVELSEGDVDAEVSEALQRLLEVGRDLADNEMRLHADAVDGHALRLQLLHERHGRVRLGADSYRMSQ